MEKIDGSGLIKEITAEDIIGAEGKEITFSACVHALQDAGSFAFVLLRTGRYVFQSIYVKKKSGGDFETLKEGAYVTVTGTVKKEERAPYGYEITLASFEILSLPKAPYPVAVSANHLGCSIETSLEHRCAALRHGEERAVFKLSEGVVTAFRSFMLECGFTEIHTPNITSVKSEHNKKAFKLRYFGKDAYLTQNPQLYKQMCVAFFDRVFEITPAYRAEKHNSTRHLNEYTELDFEMAFINGTRDVMAMLTAFLKYMTKYIAKRYKHETDLLNVKIPVIKEIPLFSFHEALKLLGKDNKQPDLDPTDEMKLCRYAAENYGSEFIFVDKFPAKKRPFYNMDCRDNPVLSESFDLLFRGVSVASGGQRIHDYDEQIEKLIQCKINPEDLSFFTDAQKYGMPPHGGAGVGLERFVMKLLGLDNIRSASLFPRDLHHLIP